MVTCWRAGSVSDRRTPVADAPRSPTSYHLLRDDLSTLLAHSPPFIPFLEKQLLQDLVEKSSCRAMRGILSQDRYQLPASLFKLAQLVQVESELEAPTRLRRLSVEGLPIRLDRFVGLVQDFVDPCFHM